MDYYDIINKFNSTVFSIYNFCAKGLFALRYPFLRGILKRNKHFHNKHKGERCFILGLGPSLKKVDLNLLKNETVFAVNSFYKFDKDNILIPKYYCLIDQIFYTSNINETEEIVATYPDTQFFFNIRAKKKFKGKDSSNRNFLYARYIQHKNYIKTNASKCMTAGMNVIHSCIQLALYMGFSEIYLLGCDMNYLATRFAQHHCYETEEEIKAQRANSAELVDGLKRLSDAFRHHDALDMRARKSGAKIYNTSLESYVMSYEFKNLEEVLS